MSNNIDILRKAILVCALICLSLSKYNEEETLTIQTQETTIDNFQQSFFPPNQDQQIMVLNYNQTNNFYIQTVYDFNGTIICQRLWNDINVQFIAWQLLTNGLYYQQTTYQIFKSTQPCDEPTLFHKFQSPINTWRFSSKDSESYGVFFQSSNLANKIDEYDLVTGNISRSFSLLNGEKVNTMFYSTLREFLFVQVSLNDGTKKVIVFDIQTLERLRQVSIDSTLNLAKGENSENRFLCMDMNQNLYSVDENGNTVIVFNSTSDDNKDNFLNIFCTDDNELVTLRESSNNTTRLISYNMLDGSVIQNFIVNFKVINVAESLSCSNQYLSLMDQQGTIHIFYPYQEHDNSGSDDGSSFPTWAIIVIVIGSVMIIGGIAGMIIRKRKQKAGQYRRFTNKSIKPGLKD